jgi:hypothetical protein
MRLDQILIAVTDLTAAATLEESACRGPLMDQTRAPAVLDPATQNAPLTHVMAAEAASA